AVSPAPVGAEAATAAAAANIASEGPAESAAPSEDNALAEKEQSASAETQSVLKVAPAAVGGVLLLPQDSTASPPSQTQEIVDNAPADTGSAESQSEQTNATALAASNKPEVAVAVQPAVDAWLEAWRAKNINAYLDAYADDFKPEGGVSKKAWLAQRKQRLSGKRGDISLSLEDIAITQSSETLASVQFFQKYASKVYSDEVTKQLDLRFDSAKQRWLITREFVVANGKRPSANKVLAPEETSEHLDGVIEKIGF
ncbi:MAG: hypothetical protein U1C59_12035, partial [Methylotenera sp.]|nr:hypothetical protein [Methylotenera sp.]